MEVGDGIYKDSDPTLRKSINTGYIIIPENVDRVQFIKQCLRTELFSILVEGGGGIAHNCYITKSALRDVEFPIENNTLGSCVTFFTEPFGGKAIITGVISKGEETGLIEESTIVFKKTKNGNYALLSVDGNGQITIDIIGTAQQGKLNINVRNDDYSAEVNLHVKGNINIYTEGNIDINTVGGDITMTTDQTISMMNGDNSVVVDKTGISIDSGKKDILIYNEDSSIGITDSGIELDSSQPILINGQKNVLYSKVPDATEILDVSEIGVSTKVKVG